MLTDSAIGEALERVYAANATQLFRTLSLTVFKKYEIEINSLHSDTTSVTLMGIYENNVKDKKKGAKEPINITHGHNKDHRPDCKQAVFGQISNEAGIMLSCNPMDGNTSDVTWNKDALGPVANFWI